MRAIPTWLMSGSAQCPARVTHGAKLDDYHQAQAVGVMNYWAYSNGRCEPVTRSLEILRAAAWLDRPPGHSRDHPAPTSVIDHPVC